MPEFKYTIARSNRRQKITIAVERDRQVIVHAPERTSEEEIRRIVESKKHWILGKISHPQKYNVVPHPPGKELVNGESALYLGRNYRVELSGTKTSGVRFEQRFRIAGVTPATRRNALRDWYKERAVEIVLPRAQYYSGELGVEYADAKIVDNRYRWGSCTEKGAVSFNWRLIKAPMMVINYVVVHELAHLLENNHSPAFWNIVRTQLPSAEKARRWLKEHGDILETDL